MHNESLPVLCLIGHQLEEALGHLSRTETIYKNVQMCSQK